jgi:molecular chaperone GrpE
MEGLEAILPVRGPFDPELHEAMAQVPTADASPDTILEVMLPGYRLRGRVLRHARVVVAGPPLPASSPGSGEDRS